MKNGFVHLYVCPFLNCTVFIDTSFLKWFIIPGGASLLSFLFMLNIFFIANYSFSKFFSTVTLTVIFIESISNTQMNLKNPASWPRSLIFKFSSTFLSNILGVFITWLFHFLIKAIPGHVIEIFNVIIVDFCYYDLLFFPCIFWVIFLYRKAM